ncbi:MAG: aminotransferase [Planctomyces sp.]|nr:aminotransferase [Planctomyces sp.]MBA4040110.1 aminotransferase [Planctomyces sp.]MBA4120586.1 aminotransferase [Isosphaera sp.]
MEHWPLDRGVVFLNHGSFGGTPHAVLRAQDEFRRLMEREPVAFWVESFEGLLDTARQAMARFVGCPPDDMAFIHNTTEGVNTVVRSLAWAPGDEILVNDHEYNACVNAAVHAASAAGAAVVTAKVPFPISGPEVVLERTLAAVTARTRLAVISHVTSPTGLVLPVERLTRELQSRGVDVLVDGAHAPAMVELGVAQLGAAYYVGNFHKWLCAPKGSAFLYVRPDRQGRVAPLTVSHGLNSPRTDRSRFRLLFDYVGTVDPTPWLATPACVPFVSGLLPGGLPAMRDHNCALALRGRDILAAAIGAEPPAPDAMLPFMASLPLPAHSPDREARLAARPTRYADALQDRLVHHWGVQVPVWRMPALTPRPARLIRISAQVYNTLDQYHYLAHALSRELARERTL